MPIPHAPRRSIRRARQQLADWIAPRPSPAENAAGADAGFLDFAAALAHDLNNSIGVVRTLCELAHRGASDARTVRRDMARALERLDSMADLAERVTSLRAGGSGNAAPLALDTWMDDMAPRLREDAGPQNRLSMTLTSGAYVRIQPAALYSVLQNLILNASHANDAAPGSRHTIAIETYNVDIGPQSYAMIAVIDDGPGIPAENAERLFFPGVTTRAAGSGSGLGLAIARRFVIDAGGWIGFDPPEERRRGAAIRLRLPIHRR